MSDSAPEQTMTEKFELLDWAGRDERPGFGGFIVPPEKIPFLAVVLRDEYGYRYLTMVTAVDHPSENTIEVVYLVDKMDSSRPLFFRTMAARGEPTVPSLCGVYPGAELQEREIYDLFGVKFEGHPDLRRILLWQGFEGHPLRKDWREPFYEDEVKPFKSRWPEGRPERVETKNPFSDNLQYPAGFDPDAWDYTGEKEIYEYLKKKHETDRKEFNTDSLVVNLGPQHPSTHGVFRMVALLDGETVVELKPVVGYLHRNHEKIGERCTFLQIMPFTDRLDYVTSMSNNFGYALAVEKLLGVTVPERADYIRVIMAELTRISSHLIATGFLLNDLGAYFTPSLYGLEERELILDIFEAVSGSRMMCNYFRFGGLARDLPEGIPAKIKALVHDRLPKKIDDFDTYLTDNEIVKIRCRNVGVLSKEQAVAFSTSGPVLRACGVPYDLRKNKPYSVYDRFDFDVVTGQNGDIYDRYLVRILEMRQSLRILEQALRDLPGGPVLSTKPNYQVKVPAGEAYGSVEGPKGELGYYIVSSGKANPERYHVRSPSFINVTSLAEMCRGLKVADAVTILGSIDIVLGEVDR